MGSSPPSGASSAVFNYLFPLFADDAGDGDELGAISLGCSTLLMIGWQCERGKRGTAHGREALSQRRKFLDKLGMTKEKGCVLARSSELCDFCVPVAKLRLSFPTRLPLQLLPAAR